MSVAFPVINGPILMLCNRASIFLVYWDFNASILLKAFSWWGLMERQIILRMYYCYYFVSNTAMFAAYFILNLKVLSNLRPAFSFAFNFLVFVIFIVLSYVQCCYLLFQLSRIFLRTPKQSCCRFNHQAFNPLSDQLPNFHCERLKHGLLFKTICNV